MRLYASIRLDSVRVDSALHETVAADLAGLLLKDANEGLSYYHPLLFRVRDPFQSIEKTVVGVHAHETYILEELLNSVRLELPHEPRVNINRDQPVS